MYSNKYLLFASFVSGKVLDIENQSHEQNTQDEAVKEHAIYPLLFSH